MSNFTDNAALNEILDLMPTTPIDLSPTNVLLTDIETNTSNTNDSVIANGVTLDAINNGIITTNNGIVTLANGQLNQATAAKQDTAQTSLTSIDGKLTNNATSTLQTAGNDKLSNIENLSIIETIRRTGFFNGKIGKVFNILGRRNGFTSTTVLNDIREFDNGSAVNTTLSNSTLEIVSSSPSDALAGTGIQSVKVVYINNSGDMVQSSNINLNGTTPVTSVLTGVNEVLWMEASAVGSGTVAAGNVRLRINGGGTEVEQITVGGNKSMSARFMIPTGYTGYVTATDAAAIGSNQDFRIRATVSTFDNSLTTPFHFLENLFLTSGVYGAKQLPYFVIPSGARIKCSTISSATPVANRADISFTLILIQD
jgi:hypothetical protein